MGWHFYRRFVSFLVPRSLRFFSNMCLVGRVLRLSVSFILSLRGHLLGQVYSTFVGGGIEGAASWRWFGFRVHTPSVQASSFCPVIDFLPVFSPCSVDMPPLPCVHVWHE